MSDDARTCADCRWWEQSKLGRDGQCRAHPAVLDFEGDSVWPTTLPTDWCGEFAPRVAPATRAAVTAAHDRAERDAPVAGGRAVPLVEG